MHFVLVMKVQHIPWRKDSIPDKEAIFEDFKREGLSDSREWSNGPGFIYGLHSHDYTKVLYCLSGSITFNIPSQDLSIELKQGDKLIVPPHTEHGALVGPKGVSCIEAPKY